MVDPILSLKNISFNYLIKNSFFNTQKILALDDVSCEIKKNQKIGFIGSNGSGKSTIAKLIANLILPDSGTIKNTFSSTFLLPNVLSFEKSLSGYDNIKVFINLMIHNPNKEYSEKILKKIIDFSELKDRIFDKVGSYSDGMHTRLAVSILTFLEPGLLIIDENIGAGDIDFQKKTLNHFRNNIEKRTVIFISHNFDLLKEFCDKSYWINNGKILDYGDTEKVYKKYTTYLNTI